MHIENDIKCISYGDTALLHFELFSFETKSENVEILKTASKKRNFILSRIVTSVSLTYKVTEDVPN